MLNVMQAWLQALELNWVVQFAAIKSALLVAAFTVAMFWPYSLARAEIWISNSIVLWLAAAIAAALFVCCCLLSGLLSLSLDQAQWTRTLIRCGIVYGVSVLLCAVIFLAGLFYQQQREKRFRQAPQTQIDLPTKV